MVIDRPGEPATGVPILEVIPSVPLPLTTPVVIRLSVPAAATLTSPLGVSWPSSRSVPPLIATAPLEELALVKVSVPVPILVNASTPLIEPDTVTGASSPMFQVVALVRLKLLSIMCGSATELVDVTPPDSVSVLLNRVKGVVIELKVIELIERSPLRFTKLVGAIWLKTMLSLAPGIPLGFQFKFESQLLLMTTNAPVQLNVSADAGAAASIPTTKAALIGTRSAVSSERPL